ncbi:MAG TPA: Calx-beta domain-containing protein [Pyrinomonadaceae bacterium]|nr:Calx-beta domain-containing protein [Pyrinomonadaceae bacterium]
MSANQTADFGAGRLNFVVTNTNDHGAGSLYQAITDANSSPGADTITFKIPGTGARTIATRVALPEITEALTIDGTTQPGFAGSPLIVLDGTQVSEGNGLKLLGGNSTIRGLVIQGFRGYGIRVESSNNVIQGNFVGLDPTGKLPRPNHYGIYVVNSSNNTIGGTAAAARNVISGNSYGGLSIVNSTNNLIQGNFIGTDAAGAAALPNGIVGLELNVGGTPDATSGNLIGGTTPGAGNLISGNSTGIILRAAGNTVQGNLIGTDATGTRKLGNQIGTRAEGANTLIGGTVPGARNVISGNTGTGLSIGGPGSKVQGNFIGTDITGLLALGNGGVGVGAGDGVLIGGTTPEARNIISANGGFGNISLDFNYSGNKATIQGNYIGTDLTGNVALDNPSHGIVMSSAGSVVGGLTPSARNVISGNQVGIQIGGYYNTDITGNVIQGNYIGLNAAGNAPLPNKSSGIVISTGSNNVVGGTQDAAGNVIAFNGGAGVSGSTGTGNLISHNSIFSNARLGIEWGGDGPSQNDGSDLDEGSNNLQNYPVLTSVTPSGTGTAVKGSLKSKPSTAYTVDFYLNTACDALGYGEGARFFYSQKLVTDANGNAIINLVIPKPLAAGKTVTATATDPEGNTSEFSPCDASATTGSLEFSAASINVLEDIGVAQIKVVRNGGSKGTLSVKYATSDLTAKAGKDYTAAAGTLVFADGETIKTFDIPVANDNVTEPDELVQLTLSGLTDLETRGAYGTAVMRIQGNDTQLTLSGDYVGVVEGDTGTKDVVVTVKLSAATSRTITVPYTTGDVYTGVGQATSGTDFQPVSGTLTFGPGVTSQTVTVPVVGDTIDELTEAFGVLLSSSAEAVVANDPIVFITDNEPDPQISIADATVIEGTPGQQTYASFTVKLSRPSDFYVQVYYRMGPGTANYEDYATYYSGSVYFVPGQTSQTILIPVFDDTRDEPNETFSVLLSGASNATITDGQALGTIVDNDPTTISIGNVTLTEGNTGSANASFKVSLSLPSAQPVTVKYATVNGTAASPADYTPASGTLTFAPGQTLISVNVPVAGDIADEEDENFKVQLSAPTNAVLAYNNYGICFIKDNDAPPKISINSITVTEGSTGTTNAAFTVSLSAASGNTIFVNYETADGTASAYSDYTGVDTSSLTFEPGQTSKTVNVVVQGDAWDELDTETFKVLLSNPYNATLATSQGVCTIKDDDPLPAFKVSDVVVTEGDSGAALATFTVTLDGQTTQNVSVKFATSNGTAVAPGDYTAKPLTTLTFGAGLGNVKEVSVYVKGDALDEENETFNLTLSGATNATIADGVGVATITDNDGASASKTEQSTSAREAASTVEFAEALYSAGEGDGRLDVTVRRDGDTSEALVVEYATADATASDRSDYGAALGQLSFAPGEESKSFTVFITDDAYAEGEESLSLSLSVSEGRAVPGGNSTAEIKVADNDNAEGAVNPLDDAQFFVRQQFVDTLGREPEPEELSALVKKLNECPAGDATCSRDAVSASLLFSDEHLFKAQLIYGLYRAALNRAPQYREFVRELHELAAGEQAGLELSGEEKKARVRDYVARWLAAAERQARKTDREFVNSLVGNSGLKPIARSELLGRLTRKEKTRADVLLEVLGSGEVKDSWRNDALVLAHYFTYLRREPDEAGYKLWLEEAKKAGATVPLSVVSGFVNSPEYRQRFGRP